MILDWDRVADELTRKNAIYAAAFPFPHIVIDDFLPAAVAEQAHAKFPALGQMDALRDFRQVKAQDPAIDKFDPIFTEIIFGALNSERFVSLVGALTGIQSLIPDPQLYAGGLAQGGDGSFLNVHIDNSSHPTRPWYRRVNLIVYLNKDWQESDGGHLEFWDEKMERCQAILPAFNRAVIFTVGPEAWHGYRKVTTGGRDTRKSINLYYFTERSPTGEDYYHVTTFRGRKREMLQRLIYPIDNRLRTLYRLLRRKKDEHAVLFGQRPPRK